MNRANKKTILQQPISTGGISILMVFTMLCLATFSVLSIGTAQAEMRLTQKNASSVADYYENEAESQRILSQIDGILKSGQTEGKTTEQMLQEISAIDSVTVEGKAYPRRVRVSVTNDGPVGVELELEITSLGSLKVIYSHMISKNNFTYGDQVQDLWKG